MGCHKCHAVRCPPGPTSTGGRHENSDHKPSTCLYRNKKWSSDALIQKGDIDIYKYLKIRRGLSLHLQKLVRKPFHKMDDL